METKKEEELLKLLKMIAENQDKMYKLLSKYDDSYLVEVEKSGQYLKED